MPAGRRRSFLRWCPVTEAHGAVASGIRGCRTGEGRREVEIPKEQILEMLRSRGDSGQAAEAEKELPDQVDTDRDKGLLSKFGIDPQELISKFGGNIL